MWSYRVEGWSDPYATWDHDATIKVAADVDTELMLEEGARVLERAVAEVPRTPEQAAVLPTRCTRCGTASRPAEARLGAGTSPEVRAEMRGPAAARLRHRQPQPRVAGRARARAVRRLVRVLPALRGRDPTTPDRAVDQPGRSPPPQSGCRPSPTWASTSSTSRRSTRSAGSTARARTTP